MFEKLLELNKKGELSPSEKLLIGYGVNVENPEREEFISIPMPYRAGHLGCFGTTGVGKTRLIESFVEQDIKNGFSLFIIDPKGDSDLFSKVIQSAAEAGRLNELMFLSPIYPEYSISLNPLRYYRVPEEMVQYVISGIKDSGEDALFFKSIAAEITTVVIDSLLLLKKAGSFKDVINLHEIRKRIDYYSLQKLKDAVQMIPGSEDVVGRLEQIIMSPVDYFSKVSSSLRTTLSALTTGGAGKIVGSARENPFIRLLYEGKRVIMYYNAASQLVKEAGYTIGRILLSMILGFSGRLNSEGKTLDTPLVLHLDEGHNVLFPGIEDLFAKARSSNIWIHLYTQSIALMEEAVGEKVTRSIIDNINTWIFMRINDPRTAEWIEETAPVRKEYSGMISFYDDVSLRGVETRTVTQDMVLELPKRHFFMRTYDGWWRGVTLDVEPAYVRVRFPGVDSN